MKKIALFIAIIIASGSLAAVFFLSQDIGEGNDAVNKKFGSLQGTEVDQESSRKVIDYFLATMGEQPLEEIKQSSTGFSTLDPSIQVNSDSFDQFIAYKEALSQLEPLEFEQLNYDALLAIHQQVLEVQNSLFSEEEQQDYFADENLIREMALEKLKLRNQASSEADFQRQWEQYLANQPDYIQRSEKNAALVQRLNTLDGYSDQQKHLARVELVGEEAANRLAKLDSQRAQFDKRMKDYLAKRDAINNKPSNESDKQQSIDSLRSQTFSETEIRRVEALERIHDDK
ncbi:lipase secretion chaperone [Vibrio penaeicida]|uniref:Lipase chaperone n=1 Tax=Vibrio penaeicida TaxID=104609 RepID=A0AAV5NQL3_9VIBR|nr:lipase secretion chaperone [Vibrio penaeicida]RTZ21932.1 lipase chaperone [Vibrio penaeicida]GLQ72272.1 lipase chaperone [Vibrio penaeicida]